MERYPFLSGKKRNIVLAVFVFVMLFLTRNTIYTDAVLGIPCALILSAGALCAVGVLFLVINRHGLKEIFQDRRMGMFAISAVVILLPMLVKRDWQLMYFSILFCLFTGIFLSYFTTVEELGRHYVWITAVMGVYSMLATYVLEPVFGESAPVFYNGTEMLFHNYGLAAVLPVTKEIRNFGIFREPGVYQYFLILALFLHNYRITWDKAWKYWGLNAILAATMVTTFATGGLIELALFVVVLFFDKKLYKNLWLDLLVAGALIVGLYGMFRARQFEFFRTLYLALVIKFTHHGAPSYLTRLGSIFVDAKLFLLNPLFGETLATVFGAVEHNTTSTMIMLAGTGILGGVLHVVSWFALVWDKNCSVVINLALCLILFMAFNTQNLVADVFLWLFPMMALTERVVPMLNAACNKKRK